MAKLPVMLETVYDYLFNQFIFIYSAIGTTRVRYRYVLAVLNGFGTKCMGRSSGWTMGGRPPLHVYLSLALVLKCMDRWSDSGPNYCLVIHQSLDGNLSDY
jgi:hypothetical protein